ncbi:MAG: DUF6884 domain-containing protein [Pseudonocardiaceae bacterium]
MNVAADPIAAPICGSSAGAPVDSPALGGLVIVGCSRRKTSTSEPVPALDLYQGWCIPLLRQRIGEHPEYRARTLILSARHGLIGADEPLAAYDQRLTAERAHQLREPVRAAARAHLAAHPTDQALLLLEPDYLDLLGNVPVPIALTVTNPIAHWSVVTAMLDGWGWR